MKVEKWKSGKAEDTDRRMKEVERLSCLLQQTLRSCSDHALGLLFSMQTSNNQAIREDRLRDLRYPVHKIANRLLPYLQVLHEQFHPEKIILFGSYAYGEPDEHSDVDLLVIKKLNESPIAAATSMRRALRPLRHAGNNLPLDLMVRDPDDLDSRIISGAAFHSDIVQNGLRVL